MAETSYTSTPTTVHDYLLLPDAGPRYQLVDGDLHMAPSPNLFHQEISRNIETILWNHVSSNRLGKILDAPLDVFLTEVNVYQPDLLFVSNQRLSLLQPNGVHGAPDLVIEILSPSTGFLDLGAKKRVYGRCGVLELWIVQPQERSVVVYNLRVSDTEPSATWLEGDTFLCDLFPGLQLCVSKFFET